MILILAAGATLVIISGGLDLSIGSVMTFAAVVSALVMKDVAGDSGEHALAAALAGLGVGALSGAAWGAINGALIAFARLPPFVVTLGSLGAALGAARLLSGGANVSGAPPEVQEKSASPPWPACRSRSSRPSASCSRAGSCSRAPASASTTT